MVSFRCGHVFGLSCVQQLIRTMAPAACPACHQPIALADLIRLFPESSPEGSETNGGQQMIDKLKTELASALNQIERLIKENEELKRQESGTSVPSQQGQDRSFFFSPGLKQQLLQLITNFVAKHKVSTTLYD